MTPKWATPGTSIGPAISRWRDDSPKFSRCVMRRSVVDGGADDEQRAWTNAAQAPLQSNEQPAEEGEANVSKTQTFAAPKRVQVPRLVSTRVPKHASLSTAQSLVGRRYYAIELPPAHSVLRQRHDASLSRLVYRPCRSGARAGLYLWATKNQKRSKIEPVPGCFSMPSGASGQSAIGIKMAVATP